MSIFTSFSPTIRLRPGLDAQGLEEELVRSNRTCEISRRTLSFYLDDMQRRGLHQALGFSSAVHFAQERLSMSRRQARDLVSVGAALRELPIVDSAFGQGTLSWSKVRLLVAVASDANERLWVERAHELTCNQLEAEVRGAEKGRPPRQGKLGTPQVRFRFAAKLNPLDHELLEQARRKACEKTGGEVSDAEFLVILAESLLRAGEKTEQDHSLYQVSVDQCPDCAQAHVRTEDGPVSLDAKALEILQCDAHIVGGKVAAATSPQLRRRVLARDGHRCVHCGSGVGLHAHHIVFRSRGGSTHASNLTTVCCNCHGMIHDGFLLVTGKAPHNLIFTNKAGQEVHGTPMNAGIKIAVAPKIPGARAPGAPQIPPTIRLSQLVGQNHIRENVRIACKAASIAGRTPRHMLFNGPPGLGKTTMARAVAAESGIPFKEIAGPAVVSIEDIQIAEGSVLFIDEIHGLARPIAELLYDTMDRENICVIGATTCPDRMPKPLRDRFTMQEEFLPYTETEVARIVTEASLATVEWGAATLIGAASMGTPRKALALLASVEDMRLADHLNCIDRGLVHRSMKQRRIDRRGFGPRQRQALQILTSRRLPMGQARLAMAMGIDRDVLRQAIEPDLLRLGYIEVTPQGLVATQFNRVGA